jgi:predicted Zn-dependent protease
MKFSGFDHGQAVCSRLCSILGFVVLIGFPRHLHGHADIEEIIADLTKQIQAQPGSGNLYFHRAEAHRLHSDWTNALSDYATALKLNPDLTTVYRSRGQTLYEANRPAEGLAELNQFLKLQPGEPAGLFIRGHIWMRLNHPQEAAADFRASIAAHTSPEIGHYIARAQAIAACGTNYIQEALEGLDQGSKRWGGSLQLEEMAIDLEVSRNNFDGALRRLDKSMERLPRKESSYVRRAQIMEKAARPSAALESYRQALKRIEALPPPRRNVRAIIQLKNDVQTAMARLNFEQTDAAKP